jgi:hypothetical protein
MAEYKPIRAHGSDEFWNEVALLAKLRGTSLGALVEDGMKIAFGEQLALLKSRSASGVANQQHEPQPEITHA